MTLLSAFFLLLLNRHREPLARCAGSGWERAGARLRLRGRRQELGRPRGQQRSGRRAPGLPELGLLCVRRPGRAVPRAPEGRLRRSPRWRARPVAGPLRRLHLETGSFGPCGLGLGWEMSL